MNETHPALMVAELMRTLVDEKNIGWQDAWQITQETLAFTNHTLLPEALEKWPVALFEHALPRHLQIVYEINRRFLEHVASVFPGERERLRRMSLIEESNPQQVRMANLAIVGSHSTNGVAEIHSGLIKTSLVPDFYQLWPKRFNNKTNGITQRRWLLKANPGLANLIAETIGREWITNLDSLRALETFAEEPGFQSEFHRVKQSNKNKLARVIAESSQVKFNPDSLFDVQVKRIHAYKRQLLNLLHIVHEYLMLTEDGRQPAVPRTYILAGKAAPGYWLAKQIIKLINNVARVINSDSRAHDWMTVTFVPDFRVSLAEKIIPAADLSEQISTAGTEASGTGNMKLALNGALTIGTMDGANIEIRDEVGAENVFIFGLNADEVHALRSQRSYRPRDYYERDWRVRRVVDAFRSNLFSPGEPELFSWVHRTLLDENDEFVHLADLPAYLETQEKVATAFQSRAEWDRMAVLNVARMGRFSSDRAIRDYARDVWGLRPA
jgi:glycogen phosphorylase